MIYEIETDYSALDRAEENEESEAPVHSSKSLNKILHQENNSAFTRIPDKGLFDFKIRPAPKHSDAPTQHQHNNDSTISRLKKKMQMRKKGKSKPTGGSMSVDGRNLY